MKSNPIRRKLKNFFIYKDIQWPMIVAHLAFILLVAVALIATVISPFYTDIFKTGDLWLSIFPLKCLSSYWSGYHLPVLLSLPYQLFIL